MNAVGKFNHVATVLSELVEQLDAEKLVELLQQGDVEITSAQRLGYLLGCFNYLLICYRWKIN